MFISVLVYYKEMSFGQLEYSFFKEPIPLDDFCAFIIYFSFGRFSAVFQLIKSAPLKNKNYVGVSREKT